MERRHNLDINVFMNAKTLKANDYTGAYATLGKMLQGKKVQAPIAILPDFTDSTSLPIGTTAILGTEQALNPSFLGRDIGCGYQLFSFDLNPERFYRQGKKGREGELRYRATEEVVQAIDQSLLRDRQELKEFHSSFPVRNARSVRDSFGSLGGGNHFIDMFVVDEIYDEKASTDNGVDNNHVYFLVHSGSRLLGSEVLEHFSGIFKEGVKDAETFNKQYLQAVREAREFAAANRTSLKESVRKAFVGEVTPRVILDSPHNDIVPVTCENNPAYKIKKGASTVREGEVAIIPGNCADSTYIVQALPGVKESYHTLPHGAGRRMTRGQIANRFQRQDGKINYMLRDQVFNVKRTGMLDELPPAYKDIHSIIDSIEEFGLAKRIARLRPVGVIVERKTEHKK